MLMAAAAAAVEGAARREQEGTPMDKTFPHPIYTTTGNMQLNAVQTPTRCAVVTGANKGIGLETVRQLAKAGVTVVLTARNEKMGMKATRLLQESGVSNVVFHQLDVRDPESIESLVNFITTQFGRLDILVNNAGVTGVEVDGDALRAKNIDPETWLAGKAVNLIQDVMKITNEKAKECLDTNYYGLKNLTEALVPLLQRSTSGARIVNVSSVRGELRRIPNEQIRKEIGDVETLTEDKIDRILQKFLHDLQHNALEANGWQMMLPPYSISKATLNAYTRLLAKKYPSMCINCVHPGYVNTDINWRTGTMMVDEGAEGSVMLALPPEGGPTGCYFDQALRRIPEFPNLTHCYEELRQEIDERSANEFLLSVFCVEEATGCSWRRRQGTVPLGGNETRNRLVIILSSFDVY
ncbi:Salutaridine reductase [Sesamum alatum]|uniref:Salutaridine reductase n=1 Tax=Sesamum alatum TaxID=300844 RepID=A0AAE2CF17_9LAMI|nr:Salutaridine reductase [Sesamum alatum]